MLITATLTTLSGTRPRQHVATADASVTVVLQAPAPPSDGDPILAACASLNQTTPLRPVSTPALLEHLGQYDAAQNSFVWTTGAPFYTTVEVIQPDPTVPGGPTKPVRVTHHYARVPVSALGISVDLVNNASTQVALTANGKTGVAPVGSPTAVVEGPFVNDVLFSFGAGGVSLGVFELKLVPELLEAGCIVFPALPVAVIYQPPTGVGTLTTTNTTGVALTDFSSDIFSNTTPTDLSNVTMFLHAVGDFIATVGDISGLTTSSGANPINAIGDAINTIADSLSFVPPAGSWQVRVQTDDRMEVTAALGQSWSSVPQLGPGDGDVILYLQNVTFLVYKDSQHTVITPMRFDGIGPQDVTVARLRPGAANPPALPEAARAALLQFDPFANGRSVSVLPTNRFSFVQRFTDDNVGVARTLTLDYTEDSTMVEFHSLPMADGTQSSVGTASRYARQGQATTATVQATGPFDFEVYYDRLFGTFAYIDKTGTPRPPFATDVAPGAAASGENFVFVARNTAGGVSYSWGALGSAGSDWIDLGGQIQDSPVAALVGTYLFVVARGMDDNIWLNQGDLGRPFVGWRQAGPAFRTDVAPGAAASGENFVFVARNTAGGVSYSWGALGSASSDWIDLGGQIQDSPAAALVGTYLFVVARGMDGNIWLNQGDLGRPFVGWRQLL